VLDQERVLDLLMGANLYQSPYVFVRELLQNAIDASRMETARREEKGSGGPIQVSLFVDKYQCRWVRFDDCGTGMDEQIIRQYLLKVGASYYNSAQFRADVLSASRPGSQDFMAISRFGIGLLSCFITCDRVEIATLRQLADGRLEKPARLALDGLQGFFVLQNENMRADPMPAPEGSADPFVRNGYRTTPGTSIACRLNPKQETGESFNLRRLLAEAVFAPPIPVAFEEAHVGGDLDMLAKTSWCEASCIPIKLAVPVGDDTPPFDLIRQEPPWLELRLYPIDLCDHAATRGFADSWFTDRPRQDATPVRIH
jgi:hypothetical protein